MTDSQKQLLNELRQICLQYKNEVPSKRRPWPESIRIRILRLKREGISFHAIAAETGIPAMTLYSWGPDGKVKRRKKLAGAFLPVKIAEVAAPTTLTVKHDAQPSRRAGRSQLGTVTVVLTSGIRVEGLDALAAAEFIKGLA